MALLHCHLPWPNSGCFAGYFALLQDGQLDGVEDICTLSIVTEAALLYSVRARYFRLAGVGGETNMSENSYTLHSLSKSLGPKLDGK